MRSYYALCGGLLAWLKRDEIMSYFGGIENFMEYHRKEQSMNDIHDLVIEEDE